MSETLSETYTIPFDPVAFGLIFLIVLLFIAIIYVIVRARKKAAAGPSHLEMYFDSNFRSIIDEWDLMPRSRLKEWKAGMGQRLDTLGKDIDYVEKQRKSLDSRMTGIENDIAKLERL